MEGSETEGKTGTEMEEEMKTDRRVSVRICVDRNSLERLQGGIFSSLFVLQRRVLVPTNAHHAGQATEPEAVSHSHRHLPPYVKHTYNRESE